MTFILSLSHKNIRINQSKYDIFYPCLTSVYTYEKANIFILFIHILYFMVVFEIYCVNFRIWGVTQRRFYWP